jgi:hypothetical protein
MNVDSSRFQWFGLALMRHQHRTIIKTDWQRQSFIHGWLSFVIGQRRWLGLVSVIAKTADYDQKQSLESPCRFAYI